MQRCAKVIVPPPAVLALLMASTSPPDPYTRPHGTLALVAAPACGSEARLTETIPPKRPTTAPITLKRRLEAALAHGSPGRRRRCCHLCTVPPPGVKPISR